MEKYLELSLIDICYLFKNSYEDRKYYGNDYKEKGLLKDKISDLFKDKVELKDLEIIQYKILIDIFYCVEVKKCELHYCDSKYLYLDYKDYMVDIINDKTLLKKLDNKYKNRVKKLFKVLNPNENIYKTTFYDYKNPLAMIAYINNNINRKITKEEGKEILNCILLDKIDEKSKASMVVKYCVNNLVKFLNKQSKQKLAKFILADLENKELFLELAQKYPDNYLPILYQKEILIKIFPILNDDEIKILTQKTTKKDIEFLNKKIEYFADKLYMKSNTGGTKAFFNSLETEFIDDTPKFSEMLEVLNNIYTNTSLFIKKIENGY